MPSLFWYCGLATIGLGCTVITLVKKKNIASFIWFYLFTTCITWFGEFFALTIFGGYQYKPGVFTDYFTEDVLGHLILNSTLYPGTAIVVSAFSLGYGWILLITAGYVLVEYLFLKIGIYEHHWWRYYMSAIIVFLFHIISKKWFVKMNKYRTKVSRNITFFIIAFIIMDLPNPVLLLSGKQYYNVNFFENLYRSSSMFTLFYYGFISFVVILFVCILDKWYLKLAPIVILLAVDSILVHSGILVLVGWWNLYYLTIVHSICLFAFIMLERNSLRDPVNRYSH